MMMKKVTILALHLGYGGIEQYLSSLCKMLENNYNIEIISTYKTYDKPAFEFSNKINIKYLIDSTSNKHEFINSVKKIKLIKVFKEGIKSIILLFNKYYRNIKTIKKLDTDYVITTRSFHNKLVSKYASNNIIKIATEHNHHNNNQKYIKEIVNSCKGFDYFIAISNSLYESYKSYLNKTKCVYIPNAIDKLPSSKSKLNNNTLVSIGRLSQEKGFLDLVSVIKIVQKEIPDIKLHLIGDGNQRELIVNKIKELNLENNIIMHGYLNREKMEEYILDSSIYVMTSYTESFGLVLLEAFSYGLPCIAFDSAIGATELIGTDNGILIPNRNKEEMASQIVQLLKDKKLRQEHSKNNRKKAEEYLLDNVKEKWIDLLEGKKDK